MKKIFFLTFSILFSVSFMAQDTFSICAVDTITGEIGSAGASCIYINQGVVIISDVHPGVGVIHTQASYNNLNQDYAKQLMNDGFSPQEIITSLVLNDVQGNPTIRQYGVVDFRDNTPRSAAYTGSNCLDYKNHITGPNYAIQGNILLGQQILDSIEARFLNSQGPLACRLMEALQGANVPGADSRCLGDGISSIGAFLRVAKPDDPVNDLYLEFNLPRVNNGVEPLDSLQVLVDQWGGCNLTGISHKNNKQIIKVYPNPANEHINFTLVEAFSGDGAKLFVYNPSGQKISELRFENSQTLSLNVRDLAPGLYTFQLMDKHSIIQNGKFIVE